MKNKVIYTSPCEAYRISEYLDTDADIENLKGDTYNPTACPDIPIEELKRQEREFLDLVNREGVFGYELERWNPKPDTGWEHVDSCWGFVGQYSPSDESFNHYIVDEMKNTIKSETEIGRAHV